MDPNDRARGSSAGRAAGKGGGTVIRGPNSALTDYLQEIGVTEHFRERRRREAEERVRVEANGAGAGAGVQAGAEARVGAGAEAGVENAEAGADEAEARNDEARNDEAGNDEAGNEDAEQPEAGPSTQAIKTIKTKGKRKKKAESDGEYRDEKDEHGGLNRSSARKGGKMHDCGMCGRRFLVRGGAPAGRVLCAACRRSVDKAGAAEAADAASVARRAARVGAGPVKQRKRMRKTEGGLLEFDAGLPLLQDLCVRAIARHLDRVDTFGDVSGPSLDRLSRIVSKMRVLDGRTLGLFVGAGRTAVALYDCTLVGAGALAGIASASPRLERLDLRFCGRLDGAALLALGRGLARLAHVRLDGAFLVRDAEWAAFFRAAGARLRTFSAAFAGFGAAAMRALVTHGVGVEALRLAECSAFDDDCLAMLAAPITEYEETAQEAERVLRAAAGKGKQALGAVPAWQPLAQLRSLELQRPHHAMSEMTARRVVRALGAQLRVLDVAGFRDVGDGFVDALAPARGLQQLGLAACDRISAPALAACFAGVPTELPTDCAGVLTKPPTKPPTERAGHGLARVDLARCYALTDAVVRALVRHSGATLRELSLNSVDDCLTHRGLLALGGLMYDDDSDQLSEQTVGCAVLEELDVSWVRSTTDRVLEQILPRCKSLARVSVYGCGGVSAFAPVRPGLKYVGRECDTL